ncbi:unnamed protein product [Euphydryas editha]|uniref:Neuropeptide-like 4 n=1 Tax=Euphydryas editha TaxID=104508 RepID=A0AAU9TZC4_EUPED|nr:unnamed protein product [Euphydryas editha]
MFSKLFALFALFAVALAAPKAKPDYQVLAYSPDYVYPAAAGIPSYVSTYSAAYAPYTPVAYSGYAYPANTVFYK